MKCKEFINRVCLYFSYWNNKGYSIFIGLGHEVHISRLALHMYEKVLLKSASHGVIINEDHVKEIIPCPVLLKNIEKITNTTRGKVCPDDICQIIKLNRDILQESNISFFIK